MIKHMSQEKCCIFDIQRFSVHDGPGIRTNVFLKGCQLRCRWCCNPESQNIQPELLFQPENCIDCGNCISACKTGAAVRAGEMITLLRDRCVGCGDCVDTCYANARMLKGEFLTADDVLAEIMKDQAFYEESGGGVTFSGGEPLLHADFLCSVMEACKQCGINTAIETCGQVEWDSIEKVLPYTDLFLYDVKHLDSHKHCLFTGKENHQIQDNLLRLAKIGAHIIIRVPVIPTFNMDLNALASIVHLAEKLHINKVNLLPYHRYAEGKYRSLGRQYWHPGVEKAEPEEVAALAKQIHSEIVQITIGG